MPLNSDDTLLNGQYRILRLLGRGGFGFVYQARDAVLNDEIAIKELIPALVGDEGLTHDELVEAMGRRDLQDLSGVLGALGRRISGVPGYGEARRPGVEMVISRETPADGQRRLRLVPEMRKALEELDPGWLHEMTP
jgi:serine/threonine protein kinase